MIGRILASALLCMTFAQALGADFGDLRKEFMDFRAARRGDAGLFVEYKGHNVELKKLVTSPMSNAAGETAVANARSLPILKISDSGNWLEYAVDDETTVMRPVTAAGTGDGSRSFQTRKLIVLKMFPDKEWTSFIEFAIRRGLSGFKTVQVNEKPVSSLYFYPRSYDTINMGGKALKLPPEFNRLMGLSRQYEPTSGPKGFVLLVHDPHQNVAGRFETLSGLRYLLQANSAEKYQFLVEGKYDDASRTVGLTGLAEKLPAAAPGTSAAVHALLANFVVNVPLAYRLLYARDLPAYAIDDNSKLSYPDPGTPRKLQEQIGSLESILTNLESVRPSSSNQPQKEMLKRVALLSLIFLNADISEIGDKALLEHFTALTKFLRETNRIARLMKPFGLQVSDSDVTGLGKDADFYDAELVAYRNAYERNETMSGEIVKRVSKDSRVSVAFIGSYHTQGVTAALRLAGIGYAVIEPHARSDATTAESQAFHSANLGVGRSAYLANLRLNMGYVAPTQPEVTLMSPQVTAIARDFAERTASSRQTFARIAGNRVDPDRLVAALGHNAGLSRAGVSGSGGPPIPPDYSRAFAFYEPDRNGGGRGGSLMLLDPTDGRWADKGRYDFLSLALFKAQDRSREIPQISHTMFYRDSDNGALLYATVYDPSSDRIYVFEGNTEQVAPFVPKPDFGEGKRGFIRMQVVENEPVRQENSDA